MNAKESFNRRALKAAKDAAVKTALKAKQIFTRPNNKPTDWTQFQKELGVTIPPAFTAQPFKWTAVSGFIDYWKSSAEARLQAEIAASEQQATTRPKLKPATETQSFGAARLLPEQQAVKDALVKDWFIEHKHRIALNDGGTGSGKTYLAAGLIADCIAHQRHRAPGIPFDLPYKYFIVTRKTVVEPYKRVLEEFGLGKYLGTLIIVTSYSQLSASFGELFAQEITDPYTDEVTLKITPHLVPFMVIWDEGHALNNPETFQTKFAIAMQEADNPPYQLWMTATPFVTVNNARTFILAARPTLNGITATSDNFKQFAGQLAARPERPNQAASKRLRDILSNHIYSFPKVKWNHKAINQVLIVDFQLPKHRELYDQSYELFLERKRKAGQNTNYGKFEEFVAIGQFRKSVEPFRVPAIVERTQEHLVKGDKAVLIGCAFRETVAQLTYRLHDFGLKRNEISIIWGGKREWKKDLLLTDAQLNDLILKTASGERMTAAEYRALQETVNFKTERIMSNETPEEQTKRLAVQKSLGLLGSQSAEQRQTEIDKFQSGQSRVCIFTLAAGGVGLSLDHNKPHLLPRVAYLTPTYSGPEFQQALGRAVRRTTLSDTYQYLVYMRGTVEETHVAPLIDSKMKCIASFTNNLFNVIDLDTATRVEHRFRDVMMAVKDAEDEASQFTGQQDDTDSEEEENDDE